jgi:cysteine synthase A
MPTASQLTPTRSTAGVRLDSRHARPSLRRLSSEDLFTVAHLILDPEQEPFAGKLDEIFAQLGSSAHPECDHPFAIATGGVIVGFFILRERDALPEWAPAGVMTLHSFRIGLGHQGRGFGRAGVELARGWISTNRRGVDRLMLGVNVRNLIATAAYLACGFTDTGQLYRGPIGAQHILSLFCKVAETGA